MRCRSCGRVMQDGLKKCPHCGSIVHVGGLPSDEFTWNVPEYKKPEPRKKVQMDINWQDGQIIEKDTGRVYTQSNNRWSDSVDKGIADQEFSFDLNSGKRSGRAGNLNAGSDGTYKGRISSIEENPFTIPTELNMDNVSYEPEPSYEPAYEPVKREQEQIAWFPDFDIGKSSKPAQKKPVQKKRAEQKPRPQVRETRKPEKKDDEHLFFGVSQKSGDVELNWSFTEAPESKQKVVKKIDTAQQKKMKAKGLGKAASGVYSAPEQMQVQQYDPFEKQHKIKSIRIPKFISEGNGVKIFPEVNQINIENAADEFDTAIGFAVAANEMDAKAAGAFQKLMGIEQRFTEELDKIVYMTDEEKIEERRVQHRREQLIDIPEIEYLTIEDEFDKYCTENGIEKAKVIPEKYNRKADDSDDAEKSVKEEVSSSDAEETEEVTEADREMPVKTRIVDIEAVNGIESDDADKEISEGEDGIFWERNNSASRLTITDIFGPEARKLVEDGDDSEKAETEAEEKTEETADQENASAEELEEEDVSVSEKAEVSAEKETAADESTVRLESEELRNLTDESSPEEKKSDDKKVEDEQFEEIEEYVYVVNEERPTKQEILNMTSEEMEQKAAEKESRSENEANKASDTEKSGRSDKKSSDPEKSKKSADSEKSKKAKKKLKKPKLKIKKKAKKTEKTEKTEKVGKSEKASKRKSREKAEKDPKNKIYIIIIAVLAIAIFLEFFIFAVKVLNPDSLAGNIIRGIEGIFNGTFLPGSGGKLL